MTENLIPEAVASAAAAGGVAAPSAAKPHDRTRRVMVGDVPVGGGAPVAVQSMLNAPADDVAANLAPVSYTHLDRTQGEKLIYVGEATPSVYPVV